MPNFITMSCPTCGANLPIINGSDRTTCAYCGNTHVVHGEMSLEPVLATVHYSLDNVAAELAIPRLTQEIARLEDVIRTMGERPLSEWLSPSNSGAGLRNLLIVDGIILGGSLFFSQPIIALVAFTLFFAILIASIVLAQKRVIMAKDKRYSTMAPIEKALIDLRLSLIEKRRIVGSYPIPRLIA